MEQETLRTAESPRHPFVVGPSAAFLLDTVRREGAIARSNLPALALLSQQSVHRLSEDLVARGFLQLQPPKIVGRGKPSPRLSLRPDGAYGLGVAIDSDSISVALANLAGEMLHHATLDVDVSDTKAVLRLAHRTFDDLIAEYGIANERISGIGVSMQGYRTSASAYFTPPLPLTAWGMLDIEKHFATERGWRVYAENNATLGAVAELWAGAGRQFSTFAYLSINFGFGGGIVLNGAPYLGHNLNAGEISSIYSDDESQRRPALSTLLGLLQEHGMDLASVRELKTRYDPGWPAIDEWVAQVTPALNQMIRAFTGILDPAAIVFGGEAPLDIRQRLITAAVSPSTDRLGRPASGPELLLSHIEADPSVLGAALLPIRKRLFEATHGK